MQGGMYALPLQKMREAGQLCEEGAYVHQPYPKYWRAEHPGGREVALVVSDIQQEAAVALAFEEALEIGLKFDPQWTKGSQLLEQVEIHNTLAGRRAAARDPQAAARARLARMREEMERLQAELAGDSHLEDVSEAPALAANVAAAEDASLPGASPQKPRRRELPVVAD